MVALPSGRPPGFVLLAEYLRATAKLFSDEEQRAIEALLIANPNVGDVIPATGGVRKLRVPFRFRGKRGGARVIYYYRQRIGRIYLITAYDKAQREDLAPHQRREFRRLIAILEREP
jgi:hypothetical protein